MDDSLELFCGPPMGDQVARKATSLSAAPTSAFGMSHLDFRPVPDVADEDIELIDDVGDLSLHDYGEAEFGAHTVAKPVQPIRGDWALAHRESGRLMLPRELIEPVNAAGELVYRAHHEHTIYTRTQLVAERARELGSLPDASFSWLPNTLGRAAVPERSVSPPPPAGAVLTSPWVSAFQSELMAKMNPALATLAAKPRAFGAAPSGFTVAARAFAAMAQGGADEAEIWRVRVKSEAPSSPGHATPEPMFVDGCEHASHCIDHGCERSRGAHAHIHAHARAHAAAPTHAHAHTQRARASASASASACASASAVSVSGTTLSNAYGEFEIEPAIYVWERSRGFMVYRTDGTSAALHDGMRHARCHYCVNGPKLSQKRSKWLVKCRRVGCTVWLCQTHYTSSLAVGLEGVDESVDALAGLTAFAHTPLLCLVDCGLCCCSAGNTACKDTSEKSCGTFGGATHKCEKMRHRVYNKTKRRKAGLSADSDSGDGEDAHVAAAVTQRPRKRSHRGGDETGESSSNFEPQHKRRRSGD